MEFLILWIIFAVTTAFIASAKGRSPLAWGAIGFVGGIFALVAIIAVPRA
jgi:hypothetical protein